MAVISELRKEFNYDVGVLVRANTLTHGKFIVENRSGFTPNIEALPRGLWHLDLQEGDDGSDTKTKKSLYFSGKLFWMEIYFNKSQFQFKAGGELKQIIYNYLGVIGNVVNTKIYTTLHDVKKYITIKHLAGVLEYGLTPVLDYFQEIWNTPRVSNKINGVLIHSLHQCIGGLLTKETGKAVFYKAIDLAHKNFYFSRNVILNDINGHRIFESATSNILSPDLPRSDGTYLDFYNDGIVNPALHYYHNGYVSIVYWSAKNNKLACGLNQKLIDKLLANFPKEANVRYEILIEGFEILLHTQNFMSLLPRMF